LHCNPDNFPYTPNKSPRDFQISGFNVFHHFCPVVNNHLYGAIPGSRLKAPPEDQITCGYQQKLGHDPNMNRAVRLFAVGFSQVPDGITEKHTTDLAIITAQSVLKTRPDGAA